MSASQLAQTAQEIAAKPRGILAADESTGTIEKRLKSIDVVSSEDNRRDYRELLFRAEGLGEFVSGVILYDETIRQKAGDGTPLTSVLGDPEGIRARVLAAMEEAFGEGPSTGADRRRRPSVHR